jgi:hypothetical protein
MVLADPMPTAELRKAEQLFPPTPEGDCSSLKTRATLGQILRPSSVPGLVYEFKPNTQGCYRGVLHLTNRDGQRSRKFEPYARPKPKDTHRILLLGDSWAYGQSVDYEASIGAELERSLRPRRAIARSRSSTPESLATIPPQEAAYLAARGMSYEPDCIVVIFVSNDMGLPFLMLEPRDPLALRRSYLFDALRGLVHRQSSDVPPIPPGMTEAQGPHQSFVGNDELDRVPEQYRYMVGVSGYKRALQSIGAAAQRIPVINVTDYSDVAGFGVRDGIELRDFQEKLGIHYAFVPIIRDQALWVAPDDGHPNARGHAELARRVLQFLEQRKLCLPALP